MAYTYAPNYDDGGSVKVLRLLEYQCRETVGILRDLLTLALQGKLRGLMVCYRTEEGEEPIIVTGAFKVNPNKAAGASLRMSLRLMQANGEIE